MFKITNLSANSLTLSDGRPLAPHDSRELAKVNDRDRGLASRGWLQIHEVEVKPAKVETPTAPKSDPKKQEVEK